MGAQKPKTKEQRRARRAATQVKSESELWNARVEFHLMLDALKRDSASYLAIGRMRARKVLASGHVVVVEIREPAPHKGDGHG